MEFEELVEFKIADKVGSYFKFDKTVLGISFDLYISRDVQLELKSFRAEKGISIFRKINELGLGPSMYIGGEKEFALPEKEFRYLLDNFPNTYELKKYASARISSVLRNYLGIKTDHEKKYRDYLDKKISKKGTDVKDLFRATEEVKFLALYEKLIEMLEGKNSYNESQWQNEILQIILLLYPKYIYVIEEAKIRDTYNQKTRRLDFLLIDSSGNTDIVEIKQPFDQCIVSRNTYRDNYIPVKELSGSVMQVEKYIFYLNKWGKKGEQALTEKYKKELPDEFQIKITNPSGIIIMGREHNLSLEQRQDFEVIKRKYKNVIDIITYDDLLKRLKFIIDQLSS
ncbi:MAG: hypothetical protein CME32_09755 [Gimesia sp.]|nr:hypothetical protein [Gimesia sp.]